MKYAIKNRRPRQRSAFTYCEDEIPSRIDFGKSKYGGPFTTEQVEDVKTFFRMIGIVLITSAVYGMTDETAFNDRIFRERVTEKTLRECSYTFFFADTFYITGTLLILLNETLIYPLFYRCLPSIKCYWKVVLGILLHLGRYIVLAILVAMAKQNYLHTNEPFNNGTVQCPFHKDAVDLSNTLDYRWFAIPNFISAISYLLIIIGGIEFFCAQVPYSMKGLLTGMFYGLFAVFLMVNGVTLTLFKVKSSIWKTGTIFSCEFWYLQMKIILFTIIVFIIFSLVKCYKKRRREDVLPNEQIFAERYYSKDV